MDVKNSAPLKIEKLVKAYGSFLAVDNISFTMKPGEIFGLLGPNGAGKTSLISCLVTLQKPTSGHCEIFGFDPQKDDVPPKLLTGFVPQEIVNHGYFTVEEILIFHSGFYQVWNNLDHIHYLLKKLGLWDHKDKKVKALSGGMKRRLLIAKALVHRPKLLLLDEPTAGVDVELRTSLWNFVRELRDQGMSILLTTHYLEEAEKLCDRVGIIQNGQLKTIGPTRELIEKLTERKITLYFNTPVNGSLKSPYLQKVKGHEAQFSVPNKVGLGELLDSIHCDMKTVEDIKISEGHKRS